MMTSVLRWCLLLTVVVVLSACASTVPQELREGPAQQLRVTEAQQQPEASLLGRTVRWGGEIIAVRNLAEVTRVEILARNLGRDGEPEPDGAIDGRFVAQFDRFLDPAALPAGDRLTVLGKLAGREQALLGDYLYPYPVVLVEQSYHWPKPAEEIRVRHVYPYHPWYPWYPYGPYWW